MIVKSFISAVMIYKKLFYDYFSSIETNKDLIKSLSTLNIEADKDHKSEAFKIAQSMEGLALSNKGLLVTTKSKSVGFLKGMFQFRSTSPLCGQIKPPSQEACVSCPLDEIIHFCLVK